MSIENVWSKLKDLNDDGMLDALGYLGGEIFWVDGANGSDANYGKKDSPLATLDGSSGALARCTAGKNDTVVIKNSGGTIAQSCVRLSAALDWNKACTHIIAQTPVYSMWSPRASIRPNLADTAFANFFTVSARGCLFRNIGWVTEFTTGIAASIPLTVSAPYNRFQRCQIAGMIDATSAASTTSRCLKLTAGENLFEACTIGVDTISRGVANANIEFASGCARNTFIDCIIPIYATAAGVLGIIVASGGIDRFELFRRCSFLNWKGATAMDALATLAAGLNGALLFEDCKRMNIADWGTDATSLAQMYISDGGTPSGHTGGAFVVTASS